MTNYYQKYELSRSLNGDKIVHIARNAAGNVVFREASEDELKKAIDEFENNKKGEEEEREKLLAKRREAHNKGKKLLTNELQEAVQEKKEELGVEQPPDSAQDEETEVEGTKRKKSNFWDSLK